MPRYYCDYCDTYLTHDSPSVRKQHNAGYKHKANVRIYYQQFEEQQTQQIIDQRIKEHLGQAAAFQQVGAAYNQHLMGQRPGIPILPTPVMPRGPPLSVNPALMRPPVLPRPGAPPGYMPGPPMAPMMAPPGAPPPGQINGLQGHPTVTAPTTIPGSSAPPSSGAPNMVLQPMYQSNPQPPPSGGSGSFNVSSQPGETNH